MKLNEHLLTMLEDLQREVFSRIAYIKKKLGKDLTESELYLLDSHIVDNHNELWSELLFSRIDEHGHFDFEESITVTSFGTGGKKTKREVVWFLYTFHDDAGNSGESVVVCEELREWTHVDEGESINDVISAHMHHLWITYACAEDCDLTKDAQLLKHSLLELVDNN
jgi:hypothetical protein